MLSTKSFTPEVIATLTSIVKKGNTAEVRNEKGNIVIIEIDRRVKIKSPIEKE